MFAAWGSWVARLRWPVFAVTLIGVLAAGVWGIGVFGQLSEGGYTDPGSESARAADLVQSRLGGEAGDVVVIYTPVRGSIDDVVLTQRVENMMDALPAAQVSKVDSYWPDKTAQYAAADKSKAVAVLTLAATDDAGKLADFRDIKDKLDVEGTTSQIAGASALADASAAQSTKDLGRAEAVSLPIVLILLLLIFGSLVAAALPVLIGGCAVLGSLGILHLIAQFHDVNSFAVNVASLLGLGMAIDYGLFIVGRFREEQGFGRKPADAVRRTVATAGRTVLFSATLLMIALAGLLLFPQGFLKSLAYGGLAAVGLAAFLSLTLLPASLTLLGPRVDTLPVRLRKARPDRPASTGWTRLSHLVLKVPLLVALPIVAGLLVLALPITHVTFGENDERQLPAGSPSRVAVETLKADFPSLSSVGVEVVLQSANGKVPDGKALTAAIGKVPGITGVAPSGSGRDVLVLTATLAGKDPFSGAARAAVRDIRALSPPAGVTVLVGGVTARNVDSLDATAHRLPLMAGLLVGATLILMFLAFGSVVLPIKAVVMSALSLSATFGVLIWIFEDGHGASWLNVTPAPAEAGIVVLMGAVVFGLSTDYEVFLLSRMVEARTRGATTAEAVTTGLARTGRVISAAAILLIVVTGAFALSSVTTMRFVGVGMITALLLDATVVRMLLVPAVLGMLGDAAWWAPGPLKRLQERAGLAEYAGEELFPTVSVGRHAAPDSARSSSRSSGAAPRHASGAQPVVTGVVVAAAAVPTIASGSASVPALPAGSPTEVLDGSAVETRSTGPIPMPAHGERAALPAGTSPPAAADSPESAPEPADTPAPAATPDPAAAPVAASDTAPAPVSAPATDSPADDEADLAAVAPGPGTTMPPSTPAVDPAGSAPVPAPRTAGHDDLPGDGGSPPAVDADEAAAPAVPAQIPSGAVAAVGADEAVTSHADDSEADYADLGMPGAGRPPVDPEPEALETQAVPTAPAGGEPAGPPAPRSSSGAVPDQAVEEPDAQDPAVDVPAEGPEERARGVDDLHGPTVDLASHMTATEPDDATPDTTAILEYEETVDLSDRLEPRPEDSRSH